ncbi:MAG: GrpB family protein [Candidatus Pacebacteria bacterium]|nr:GrpB family protein [Candidatus Paceibacterota bacterium]
MPKSTHQIRIRFQIIEKGEKIDIFLIDEESDEWLNGIEFENYLEEHKEELKKYEELKYDCNGFSTRKYYEKKVDFINNILSRQTK